MTKQNDIIPICISTDDNSALYTTVLMKSILDHNYSNSSYEFIILDRKISTQNKDLLNNIIINFENSHISYINITQYDNIIPLSVRSSDIPIWTLDKLLLPKIINNYDKIIYLDTDTYVRYDLSELFAIDMEDNYLIATHSNRVRVARKTNKFYQMSFGELSAESYLQKYLFLINIYDYFNTGVLVFNINKMNQDNLFNEILTLLNKEFHCLDQDLLNSVCHNSVKYIDCAWNFCVDEQSMNLETILNLNEFEEYRQACFNPKIVHYKHWKNPDNIYAKEWWTCANNLNITSEIISKNKDV